MSTEKYSSSSECKQYTDEERKLIDFMRENRSQPIKDDQYSKNSINQPEIMKNIPEIIHIPRKYQRFHSSFDLPHTAGAIIRHSSATTRTLVRSDTGEYHIELNCENSINNTSNHQDMNNVKSNTNSTWPV